MKPEDFVFWLVGALSIYQGLNGRHTAAAILLAAALIWIPLCVIADAVSQGEG